MRIANLFTLSLLLACPGRLLAQSHEGHARAHEDSAFRALQGRGRTVMGVDQYTSIHRFDALPDGGRIELQRDRDDSAGTAAIRAHMRTIALAFGRGDFTAPATVHLETVPGVPVMRARRASIRYEPIDLPRGAALRIRTSDDAAITAVHQFLDYQRREHRTTDAGPHAH